MKGSTTLVVADAASFSSRQEGPGGGAVGDKRELHASRAAANLDEYDTRVLRPTKRRKSPKKRAISGKESDPGVTSGLHQARQASTDRQQQVSERLLQPGEYACMHICMCV